MKTSDKIAELNDLFRANLHLFSLTGQVFTTASIASLSEEDKIEIFNKVSSYNEFRDDNDPYNEHDFGSFNHNCERIFWKIDYYDRSLKYHSEDPSDPEKTKRIITIMYSYEY